MKKAFQQNLSGAPREYVNARFWACTPERFEYETAVSTALGYPYDLAVMVDQMRGFGIAG
jgi:hypothetical protein